MHPKVKVWLKYCKFEEELGDIGTPVACWAALGPMSDFTYFRPCNGRGSETALPARARAVYERALEFFGDELEDETLFVAFAKFEIRCSEVRRGPFRRIDDHP